MKIANPDIQFEVEGRKLTMRFSFRASAALQDHWGLDNIQQAMDKIAEMETGGLVLADYTAMLWAGLRTHNSEVTMEEALDILDYMGLQNFILLISKAVSGASMEGGGTASANPPVSKGKRGR